MQGAMAIEARGLVKHFGATRAVAGVDLCVPAGSLYGLLGPNGAGKSTTIRMLLGLVDPDGGSRTLLGSGEPLSVASRVAYLPEERGLYPGMRPREAVAFMGALRGLPLREAQRRATVLLDDYGIPNDRPIRALSKGQSQLVQLLGTLVHKPELIVLDEPFSGLDAINQERLEQLIRHQIAMGATVLFSTHVIAHAERLCDRISVISAGAIRFEGTVEEARQLLPARVRLETKHRDGAWRAALPADAVAIDGSWCFAMPPGGIEPLLATLIAGDAGIEALAIERPTLHDVFVDLVRTAEESRRAEAVA